MARFQISSWAFLTICSALCFWIVGLGGIGGVTYQCGENSPPDTCARGLQYEWYTLWFELIMMLTLLILGYNPSFHTYKPALLAFLVLVTNSLMWSARSFMTVGSFPDIVSKYTTKNAAAAGFVLLCITNYIIIWFVGTSEAPVQNFESSYTKDGAAIQEAQRPVV